MAQVPDTPSTTGANKPRRIDADHVDLRRDPPFAQHPDERHVDVSPSQCVMDWRMMVR